MVITALLLHVVAHRALALAARRWSFAVTGVFLTIDLAFFGANVAEDRPRRLAAAGDRRRASSR